MTLEEIQKKLESSIEHSQVTIEGDGCDCSAVVVSTIFKGLSLLERQRMVLAVMSEEIKTGELHALSVKTYTPEER